MKISLQSSVIYFFLIVAIILILITLDYIMKKFENISTKPGFMKHNGGLMFRKINKNKYQFKTTVKKFI